jgi:hypothetical protein
LIGILGEYPAKNMQCFPVRAGHCASVGRQLFENRLNVAQRCFACQSFFQVGQPCLNAGNDICRSRNVAEACINHLPAKLIRTYDRNTYETEKREALERWASHLAVAIAQASGANVVKLATRRLKRRTPALGAAIAQPSHRGAFAMSMAGTMPVRCVLVCMGSKSEYLAKARECERRAQEMAPAFRRTFLSLAAHWRKLASNAAEAADRRRKQNQETADRRRKQFQEAADHRRKMRD